MTGSSFRTGLTLALATALGAGVGLGVASGEQRPKDVRAAVTDMLAGFELVGTATVDVSGASGERRRRVFEYSSIVDGSRYRIDVRSNGADVPLLPRISVAFDGAQTWLLLPRSEIVTIRTGEIEGHLPVPLPDPLLLQFQAILALQDPSAAMQLSTPDLGRKPALRKSLLALAAHHGGQSILARGLAAASRVTAQGSDGISVSWAKRDGRWVPSSYAAITPEGRGEWEVLEFFAPKDADGASGIPKRVLSRAIDHGQEQFSEITVLYQVRSFRRTSGRRAEDFRLDEEAKTRSVWDEDAKIFLRP